MNNAPKSGSASDTTMSVETPPEPSPAELTAVAELIAGGNPPPWLVEYLGAFICSVWLDRSVHKYAPTKTEMKKRLEAVERAANLIVSELQDANTSVFLEDVGLGDKVKNFEIQRTVGFLAVCASAASRSPAIAAPSGKTKAGRGDAKPIGAFPFMSIVHSSSWKHGGICMGIIRHRGIRKRQELPRCFGNYRVDRVAAIRLTRRKAGVHISRTRPLNRPRPISSNIGRRPVIF